MTDPPNPDPTTTASKCSAVAVNGLAPCGPSHDSPHDTPRCDSAAQECSPRRRRASGVSRPRRPWARRAGVVAQLQAGREDLAGEPGGQRQRPGEHQRRTCRSGVSRRGSALERDPDARRSRRAPAPAGARAGTAPPTTAARAGTAARSRSVFHGSSTQRSSKQQREQGEHLLAARRAGAARAHARYSSDSGTTSSAMSGCVSGEQPRGRGARSPRLGSCRAGR